MRKLNILLLAFLAIAIISCSDDGDDNNPANNDPGEFGANAVVQTDNQGNMEYNFGVAYYDEDDRNTVVILAKSMAVLQDDNPGEMENGLAVILDGKSTGEYDLSGENNFIAMGMNNTSMMSSGGSVDITQYPEPGGELKFSMNATMMTMMGGSKSEISSNTISVKFVREEDIDDSSGDDNDNDDGNNDDNDKGSKDNSDLLPNLEKLVLKLDGEGFNNEYVEFNNMVVAYSTYNDEADQTTLSLTGGLYDGEAHAMSLTVNFEGNEPGEFNVSSGSNNKNLMTITYKSSAYNCKDGTIKVNKVGNVGELTKVEFTGTFDAITGSSSIEVTEGEVWVARVEY